MADIRIRLTPQTKTKIENNLNKLKKKGQLVLLNEFGLFYLSLPVTSTKISLKF